MKSLQRAADADVRPRVVRSCFCVMLFVAIEAASTAFGAETVANYCVDEAVKDEFGIYGNGEALWLPGIGVDFQVLTEGGWIEYDDGTARVSLVVASIADPNASFAVELLLAGRIDPGDANYPPPESPKLQLLPDAYLENGGPVDPSTWHYYTQLDGTLTGAGSLAGGVVTVTRFGPSFQVGAGANGVNSAYGGSGWLLADILSEPAGIDWPAQLVGDINVDFDECEQCVDEPSEDGTSTFATGAALWLPLVATDLVFNTPGQFKETIAGSGQVTGTLHSKANPNVAFALTLQLSDRVDFGEPNFPPEGSPKKELHPEFYIENGGPIDPSTWHYYLVAKGTLTGLGCLAGAEVDVERIGPAFQVGTGASGANLEYGASAWLKFTVVSQPAGSLCGELQDTEGDINLDLQVECVPEDNVETSTFGSGCVGTTGMAAPPELVVTGELVPRGDSALGVLHGPGGASAFLVLGVQKATSAISATCVLNLVPAVLVGPLTLSQAGSVELNFAFPPTIVPGSILAQCVAFDPAGICSSAGLEIQLLP